MPDKILSKAEIEAVNATFNVIERTVITKDFWDEVVKSHEALRGMLVEVVRLLHRARVHDRCNFCYFCERHRDNGHFPDCKYAALLAKLREAGIAEGD